MSFVNRILEKAAEMGGDKVDTQLKKIIYNILVEEQKKYNKAQGATQKPLFVLFQEEPGRLAGAIYANSSGPDREPTAGPAKIKAVKLDDILKKGVDRMTKVMIRTATGKTLPEVAAELEKAILQQITASEEIKYFTIFFYSDSVMLAMVNSKFGIVQEINFKNII